MTSPKPTRQRLRRGQTVYIQLLPKLLCEHVGGPLWRKGELGNRVGVFWKVGVASVTAEFRRACDHAFAGSDRFCDDGGLFYVMCLRREILTEEEYAKWLLTQ